MFKAIKFECSVIREYLNGKFDSLSYMELNDDVPKSKYKAIRHYLKFGRYENRSTHKNLVKNNNTAQNTTDENSFLSAGVAQSSLKSSLFEAPVNVSEIDNSASDVKCIAFYLPQFHRIAENDKWWGSGFTEWTNVSRAVPLFNDHIQPQLPGDFGFYDLTNPTVLDEQIALAKNYNIGGFCFHYYWFNGDRLLEKPLDMFLSDSERYDFPFCICWANENWTRRWDGQENDVLMAQTHTPQSDLEFIDDVIPMLKDERYIRVNGKPVLIIYRIALLPDAKKTAELWRSRCREMGVGEIELVAAQTFGIKNPYEFGFDSAIEFPPHGITATEIQDYIPTTNPNFSGKIYSYEEVVENSEFPEVTPYKVYKTVFPGWDNSARKSLNSHVFAYSSPSLFQRWVENTVDFTEKTQSSDGMFFVNAWNEWAEGAHLEPCRHFGHANLNALARGRGNLNEQ